MIFTTYLKINFSLLKNQSTITSLHIISLLKYNFISWCLAYLSKTTNKLTPTMTKIIELILYRINWNFTGIPIADIISKNRGLKSDESYLLNPVHSNGLTTPFGVRSIRYVNVTYLRFCGFEWLHPFVEIYTWLKKGFVGRVLLSFMWRI